MIRVNHNNGSSSEFDTVAQMDLINSISTTLNEDIIMSQVTSTPSTNPAIDQEAGKEIEKIRHELNTRYTVKAYDDSKRITAEVLSIITDVLHMSASSINSQPWKFIVIESDEAKQRFHDTFEYKYQTNQPHAKNASHIILFANKTHFNREDFKQRLNAEVAKGRLTQEQYEQLFERIFSFAEMNMDDNGYNGHWTKAQTYIALGGALHTLARLGIDSTPMEGVDSEMIGKIFDKELAGGYECTFALAIGYHAKDDYNFGKPKARLAKDKVITII